MSLQTISTPHSSALAGLSLACHPIDSKHELSARRVELWSPWFGRERPATAAEEARFIARLREHDSASGRPVPTTRRDITALMTALRTALTADELMQLAPGLGADTLVSAYEDLDRRRAISERAWRAIVDAPDVDSLATFGPRAAELLPVVIGQLGSLRLRRRLDDVALADTIAEIDREIDRTSANVERLEMELDDDYVDPERRHRIGELLFGRFGDGAWTLNTYLPTRVGTLVPARVASLLGEERARGRAER